jgi:2,3-bisphosphoglycerate-independent phosphoglycerate mutase
MSFYFIFWDGVGYGKKNPAMNPFFSAHLPTFKKLLDGNLPSLVFKNFSANTVSLSPVNTTLGVSGLPQSGTGQTTLITGINASKQIGKHYGPHPYSTLIPIIKEKNLFAQLQSLGKTFFFANGYPQRYFDYLFGPKGKIPTIALAYTSTGKTLNSHTDIINREAISADISGSRWNELGHSDVKQMHPPEAGQLFYQLGQKVDLIFFEYFITDHVGHSQEMTSAIEMLERMDGFIEGMLRRFDYTKDIILMISDHGNIEDLSVKTHTLNPVPLLVIGKRHSYFSTRIKSLVDVTPAIISYFTQQ